MKSLKIVFAGTPEFGLPCLNTIYNSRHNLEAVYTQPDRPAGRGQSTRESPIKAWAKEKGIPIFQPTNFKNKEDIDKLIDLKPDVMVVIAYGIILPKEVLSIPQFGCINVHASILPKWRGAAPIQYALLHGEKQSGVSIMQMDKGMDTGDILNIAKCDIDVNETAGSLHDKLAELSPTPLMQVLDDICNDALNPIKQEAAKATYTKKITKESARINWQQGAKSILQLIRAYNPWPIAYTEINNTTVRILEADIVNASDSTMAKQIISITREGVLVGTEDLSLLIKKIQLPGKKALTINEFINGNPNFFKVGLRFE